MVRCLVVEKSDWLEASVGTDDDVVPSFLFKAQVATDRKRGRCDIQEGVKKNKLKVD